MTKQITMSLPIEPAHAATPLDWILSKRRESIVAFRALTPWDRPDGVETYCTPQVDNAKGRYRAYDSVADMMNENIRLGRNVLDSAILDYIQNSIQRCDIQLDTDDPEIERDFLTGYRAAYIECEDVLFQ